MGEGKGVIGSILAVLHRRAGYDFREYRESTLHRRIARRIHARGCPTETAYLDYLLKHPEEDGNLLNDLTIRVTEFFREPEGWETINKRVLPELFEETRRQSGKEVKIWSAGCATGEEAYSLAILFEEARNTSQEARNMKQATNNHASCVLLRASILGTDLDRESLRLAQEGIYPEERLKLVPPLIRETYFQPVKTGYQIIQAVRDRVDFRAVDLVGGESPGEFDLIVCRNVLIYFSKELQERVLLKLHNSLRPGGFLWLGKAESLWGRSQELFECVDKGAKVFSSSA